MMKNFQHNQFPTKSLKYTYKSDYPLIQCTYRKSARTSRKIYPQNRICKVGGRLLCTDSEFPSEKS